MPNLEESYILHNRNDNKAIDWICVQARQRTLARRHLDARLEPMRSTPLDPPRRGWIRATRDALGMTAAELAARLGVSPQQISQYEAAERAGTIKLQTLQRVAEALGGSVHYALVTEEPMEQMVLRRARELALRELATVDHSMALEQQLPENIGNQRLERRVNELVDARDLWSDHS